MGTNVLISATVALFGLGLAAKQQCITGGGKGRRTTRGWPHNHNSFGTPRNPPAKFVVPKNVPTRCADRKKILENIYFLKTGHPKPGGATVVAGVGRGSTTPYQG